MPPKPLPTDIRSGLPEAAKQTVREVLEYEIAENERGLRGPVAGLPYWRGRLAGLIFARAALARAEPERVTGNALMQRLRDQQAAIERAGRGSLCFPDLSYCWSSTGKAT